MARTPSQAIRSLVKSGFPARTMVGRIRDLLPDIELAQRQGVRLKTIADALNGAGFPDMNVKCIQNLLYQARRSKVIQPKGSEFQPDNEIKNSGQPATTEVPATRGNGGIDIERIIDAASAAARRTPTSDTTLALLRRNHN